jgi:hypothetical protein
MEGTLIFTEIDVLDAIWVSTIGAVGRGIVVVLLGIEILDAACEVPALLVAVAMQVKKEPASCSKDADEIVYELLEPSIDPSKDRAPAVLVRPH